MNILQDYDKQEVILLLLIILIITFVIFFQNDKVEKINIMLKSRFMKGNIIIICIFSVWVIFFNKISDAEDEDDRQNRINNRQSLFIGMLSLIVSLCSILDLLFLSFWVSYVSSYYYM